MFNKKTFIEELDRFEVTNKCDVTAEEMQAIMGVCMEDEDPVYLAIALGFQCGCMKVGEHRV